MFDPGGVVNLTFCKKSGVGTLKSVHLSHNLPFCLGVLKGRGPLPSLQVYSAYNYLRLSLIYTIGTDILEFQISANFP